MANYRAREGNASSYLGSEPSASSSNESYERSMGRTVTAS